MKKNKIIPFSLLFITLTFLELFCIVKYADVFYFPLAVGLTLLGSAYLLLTEIQAVTAAFIMERDKSDKINNDDKLSAEKEEAAKLAKATYVIEKRILNLLEERLLMPEENMENLGALKGEIIQAIKVSIKYERENTNHIADIISENMAAPDNSMAPADLGQILAKFDALALELKSSQLTMGAIKEQLQTISDISRQISNNRVQYISQPVPVTEQPVATADAAPEASSALQSAPEDVTMEENMAVAEDVTMTEEAVTTEDITDTEETPEFVDTLTMQEPEDTISVQENDTEPVPEFVDTLSEPANTEPAPVTDDPNKQMSPEDIAALFASAAPNPAPAVPEPAPVADDPNKQMSPEDIAALFASSAPEPVADDPNKQMSPDDIAALFASATPEPAPAAPEPAPAADDPNKQMSPEDIAALFASSNLELEPEPGAPAEQTAIEALSKPAPEVTPVSDDPNKKMSPEDIAALFASAGQ